ncbi:MAG TPA: hypothetical protein VEX68_19790, partial [Bryobacteraceae bacterium]|nr:hypothetical protein [Bryobacteraceae bacterium]
GIGPNNFGNSGNRFQGDSERDVISALEKWVEKGVSPDRLIGTGHALVILEGLSRALSARFLRWLVTAERAILWRLETFIV